MAEYVPICPFCIRFRDEDDVEGLTCDAFPDGIPEAILHNEADHRYPYPGDHGLRFAQDPAKPVAPSVVFVHRGHASRPRLRRFPARGEVDLDGWFLVQRVAGPDWPSDWSLLNPTWQPGSPEEYFYVWRATARAPGRGTVEWRWNPGRKAWDCQLDFPIGTAPKEVANLWRDGFALFTQQKDKWPKPGPRKGSGWLAEDPEENRRLSQGQIKQAEKVLREKQVKVTVRALARWTGHSEGWVRKYRKN